MSFKIPSFLIFSLLTLSGFSQTVINGTATDWIGKTIRISQVLDPISRKETELSSSIIDADGSFSLTCDIKDISTVWISVKRYSAPIFIEPGAKYQIVIIPKPENKLVDTWLNGSFEYGFESLDSTDVNAVIGNFDNDYYNFYLDNAQLINSSLLRKKIQAFEENHPTESDSDEFINVYRESTIGEMKLSAGVPSKSIYETYFYNKTVHPENSAWYNFFDLFYADYFQNFDSRFGGATVSNRIKMGMSPDSLSRLVDVDPFMANDTLKQWVLMKSIDEVCENNAYPKSFLISSLNLIKENAKTVEISMVAQRLIEKNKNQLIGKSISPLSSTWSPEYTPAQNGLPCLLLITSSGNTESLKEKRLLKTLVKKYSSVFYVAEIEVDEASPSQSENWEVYQPDNDFNFLEEFQIYSIPYLIWIDADGNISEVAIEKPSEGLESRLFKLKAQKEQEQKIKVGR